MVVLTDAPGSVREPLVEACRPHEGAAFRSAAHGGGTLARPERGEGAGCPRRAGAAVEGGADRHPLGAACGTACWRRCKRGVEARDGVPGRPLDPGARGAARRAPAQRLTRPAALGGGRARRRQPCLARAPNSATQRPWPARTGPPPTATASSGAGAGSRRGGRWPPATRRPPAPSSACAAAPPASTGSDANRA